MILMQVIPRLGALKVVFLGGRVPGIFGVILFLAPFILVLWSSVVVLFLISNLGLHHFLLRARCVFGPDPTKKKTWKKHEKNRYCRTSVICLYWTHLCAAEGSVCEQQVASTSSSIIAGAETVSRC